MNPEMNNPEDLRAFKGLMRVGSLITWLLLGLILVLSFVGPYTDWLWFVQDAKKPQAFTASYTYRGQLFLLSFLPTWALFHWSLQRAMKTSMVYLQRPDNLGRLLVSNAIRVVQVKGPGIVRFAAPAIALLSALGFSANWMLWMMSRSAVPFGKTDPTYGMDLSFFVFHLPWIRAVLEFAFGTIFFATALTVLLYAGMQALAMFAKIELGRPHIRQHLSALCGVLILLFGLRIGLRGYEAGFFTGTQFTGAGFAASRQAQMQFVMGGLTVLLGLATLASFRSERGYRVPAVGGGVLALLGVILLGAYPSVLQALAVNPDKLNKEGPYAKRAIESTRFAYGLDRIEVRDVQVSDRPSALEVQSARATLENMRLWDPDIYRQTIEGVQGLRPYYTFHDVDLDRYELDGRKRLVMLSPRDIRIEGLSENAGSWVNQRLQYTHGFGVVMSQVNQSTEMGQPTFVMRDIPTVSTGPKLNEPRLYFSDFRNGWGEPASQYAVVNTKVQEFDYPGETGTVEHRWASTRGIAMSSPFVRALFALRLADGNLLVSGNITPESRLLIRRSVLERARAIYPFLKFDADPYVVIAEGKLKWILDAYTTTSMIPYSSRVGQGDSSLSYIRNSAKVVVDAYTGDIDAYQFEDEPIMRAWQKVYKGLVRPRSEFPKSLEAHIRYPEDMLRIQSLAMAEYHVTDPVAFLNNGDAWEIASERGISGAQETMKPYYVLMVLPGQKKEEFLQILPFTPRTKPNMSGWLAAKCDPQDYGRLLLYRYSKGALVNGPAQMEAIFNQDRVVADINRQFDNEQSQIQVGNLLVMPIGNSVMYVEPLFLRSRTAGISAIPELKKVILAFKNKVVVADTYEEALGKLFGGKEAGIPIPPSGTGEPSTPPQAEAPEQKEARAALQIFRDADQALKDGDFAKYGELRTRLKDQLERLALGKSQ